MGVGEKTDALEPFHPDRLAQRILGMGDVLSLVEKAQATVDAEQAEALAQKIRDDAFTLEDFAAQLKQLRSMGPLGQLMDMVPFFKGAKGLPKEMAGEEQELHRYEAIIASMTPARAAGAGGHQRQPPRADRAGQRHERVGREPAAQAVRPAQEDDEGAQADGRAHGQAQGRPALPAALSPGRQRRRRTTQREVTSGGSHQAETDGDDAEAGVPRGGGRLARGAGRASSSRCIGHYNPLTNPPTVKIEVERAQEWIKKGAQPSNTVKNLLARAAASRREGVGDR